MRARRNAIPAIHVDSEKDRLSEKRETFERKWHSDNFASPFHETRPQQAQFEGKHRTRYGSDGEHDRRADCPATGECVVDLVASLQIAPLGYRHQQRHRDSDACEYDVES